MSKNPFNLVAALLGCFCLCSSGGLAEQSDLTSEEQAIQQYNAGDYSNALKTFRLRLSKSPNSAQSHYYLANCLTRLDQLESAGQEYRITLGLAKDSTLASYCRLGIAKCASALAKRREDEALARAIKLIDNQAELQNQIHLITLSSSAQLKQAQIDSRVEALKSQRDLELTYMEHAVYSNKGAHNLPIYSKDQIESTRQNYEQKIQDAQNSGSTAASLILENARRASEDLHQIVTQLEDNLKVGARGSGQRLLPEGTNLYVRNYGLLDGQPPSKTQNPELTATQELLILSKHQRNGVFRSTVVPKELSSKQGQLPDGQVSQSRPMDSSRTSTTSVYGKLLQGN